MNTDEIQSNIHQYGSQKLCEMIVCHRYFGCFHEVAVVCMEELARRRGEGDDFDFEGCIQASMKELPDLNANKVDLREVLQQVITVRNEK